MELVAYNKETLPTQIRGGGLPKVRLNAKSGVVSFNREAAKLMSLDETVKLEFLHEPNSANWYVNKIEDDKGFSIREKDGAYLFSSKALIKCIFASVQKPGTPDLKAGTMRIANESDGLFPILTSSIK